VGSNLYTTIYFAHKSNVIVNTKKSKHLRELPGVNDSQAVLFFLVAPF